MANLVQELNSLDFSVYIGGPLQAAVKAQNDASMAQVEFIKEVGFNGNNLRYVDFSFKKTIPDAVTGVPAESQVTLQVPFLTMLTLPAIRIDEMTIDFNARLNSIETQSKDATFSGSASLSAKFWKVKLNASASYKKTTSSTSTTEKTYTLGVHVRAVNDELPAGLTRVLDMLEDSIAAINGLPVAAN
ncbi:MULTISPECIES: DUF2589 domain-containing protein [unclassified Chryseobacterium]|uniref:DUF2589 domain-containing protein n=1 Tax=unclassified Chryseobacterium TaxID=2593645 RepID=UPI002269F156|nr:MULTISPECIES: DUF2589 domain-containing protein [unclassified Chryseobacterium]